MQNFCKKPQFRAKVERLCGYVLTVTGVEINLSGRWAHLFDSHPTLSMTTLTLFDSYYLSKDTSADTGCAQIKPDGFWEAATSCDVTAPYICKLESLISPDEHDDPGEDLCDPEWVGFAGFCYFRDSKFSDNFDESQKRCQINYQDRIF